MNELPSRALGSSDSAFTLVRDPPQRVDDLEPRRHRRRNDVRRGCRSTPLSPSADHDVHVGDAERRDERCPLNMSSGLTITRARPTPSDAADRRDISRPSPAISKKIVDEGNRASASPRSRSSARGPTSPSCCRRRTASLMTTAERDAAEQQVQVAEHRRERALELLLGVASSSRTGELANFWSIAARDLRGADQGSAICATIPADLPVDDRSLVGVASSGRTSTGCRPPRRRRSRCRGR